jgi:hypothetical protein
MTKKLNIMVIALLALVLMMITPVTATAYTEIIGGSGLSVREGAKSPATAAVSLSYQKKWISNDNPSLPGLQYIYYKSTGGSNLTDMPVYIAETIDWYALSDVNKTHSLATAQLSTTYEIGGYRTLALSFTKRFELSELTGTTQIFNATWTGNQSWYDLTFGAKETIGAINGTETPFVPINTAGSYTQYLGPANVADTYLYSDYDSILNWNLFVSGTPGLLPISVTLTPVAGTSSINYYVYNNGLLNRSTTSIVSAVNYSHGWNPLLIVINSSSVPTYTFTKTFDFSAFTPTVTPTPITTIPAGYVRNNLYVWDQNDAQISGADVDVLDVEAATWTNTTADADGWITIDTLPYHTVNIYAHYPTANIYLPNEILGLETGYYGGHNWVLVLYPYVSTPSGYVTLYINTRNYDTKAVLTGVNLQIKNLVTGATTGESTGSTDSASTVVTNATNYQITGSKAGYLSKTVVINSGEAASKTVVLELSRATASPTPTPTLSGQPTAVPTQDENDPILHDGDTSLKAQEMMNWLAMNGMMLVQLCFLVTIFALLGVKLGK